MFTAPSVEGCVATSTDGAVNILLLGDDADLATTLGTQGYRVDAASIIRLDEHGAHLLSVPRDLADPVTGQRLSESAGGGEVGDDGFVDRAAALESGIAAIRARLGDVPVDHVVRLGFAGFVDLVDALGGVPIRVQRPIVDAPTGTNLQPSADCQLLDGVTTLGLTRARHVAGDPTSDFGRTARQRLLLQSVLTQADVSDVDALSRVLADHATVSGGLDLATMVELGRRLAGTTSIDAPTLPVIAAQRPDGAVVLELAAGAADVLRDFGADAPLEGTVAPAGEGIVGVDPAASPDLAPC